MKSIEINTTTDKEGYLKIERKLGLTEKKVRIYIFLDDEKIDDEEGLYLKSISNNPAFDFLLDPAEDIYSLNDGSPIDD